MNLITTVAPLVLSVALAITRNIVYNHPLQSLHSR